MNPTWIRSGGANLEETLNSGQIFHWFQEGSLHYGLINHEATVLEQVGRKIIIHQGSIKAVKNFLGLTDGHHLLPQELIDSDLHIQNAHRAANGVRLMNQPKWECLGSFITSAMKQVSHIRQLSLKTREALGTSVPIDHEGVPTKALYAYPTPQQLADAGSQKLRELGYGWRSETLHATAELLVKNPKPLKQLDKLPTDQLLKQLQNFPGVGLKVASCVALFSYNRKEIFPLDVWTKRVLTAFYFRDQPPVSDRIFEQKVLNDFGEHAGYIQQLFFHAARMGKLDLK